MNRTELVSHIKEKRSFLCIGLDTDVSRIPPIFEKEKDPLFAFNKAIIDATHDLAVAYKPNIAFYERHGSAGWKSLEKTIDYIPDSIFTIADAKRGDIGNTSKMYASAFFEHMNFDAVTVAPYMGEDSVAPFLEFENKWVILLGLTSNRGSQDFQHLDSCGKPLYASVIDQAQHWGNPENLMYVIGATHPEKFAEIRSMAKDYFLLVPGVGAQGGSVEAVAENGRNDDIGLLINSSRGILYAGKQKDDFATKAREAAKLLRTQMSTYF